jgi:hypothetical protein
MKIFSDLKHVGFINTCRHVGFIRRIKMQNSQLKRITQNLLLTTLMIFTLSCANHKANLNTKNSNENLSYNTIEQKNRTPAQAVAVKSTLDDFIRELAKTSSKSEVEVTKVVNNYVEKNSSKLGITSTKNLTSQEEEKLIKALIKSTKIQKELNLSQDAMINAYADAKINAKAMQNINIKSMSSMKNSTNEFEKALSDIKNPELKQNLQEITKSINEAIQLHPEYATKLKSIASETTEISKITGQKVLGKAGCTNILDDEALSNLEITLKNTKNEVKAGKDLDESLTKNLAKAVDEEPKYICQRIIPLKNECGLFAQERFPNCK